MADLIDKSIVVARFRVRKLFGAFCEPESRPIPEVPVESLMSSLKHVRSVGPYTRDEMNQR
jgi:hypothetical protein